MQIKYVSAPLYVQSLLAPLTLGVGLYLDRQEELEKRFVKYERKNLLPTAQVPGQFLPALDRQCGGRQEGLYRLRHRGVEIEALMSGA
jgi:hypothetical protein